MADYELQGEITTNTIDSEILSAPVIESEMMLGDTVVIDHYYNGLESDTVKVTVDNDNNTIKADVNVGASVLDFAESEYNKSKNLFNENKYLSSYCTYASNRWTTNSTRIGYNQSILTNEAGATDNRNTSKLPLLKKGTYTLTIFNTVNNTNDTSINIALYNQDGTINGTYTRATITTNTTITFTLASDLYLDIRVTGDVGTISFDHIQVEKGSIATAYYPYSGEITHNGDAAVVFADAERQKSKNLFDAPNITMPTKVTYNSSTNTFTYTSGEVAEGATAFAQLNNVVMPAGNYVYSFDSTSTITGDTTYIVAKLTSTGGFGSSIKSIIAPAGKVSIPFTLTEDTYIGLCWYYKTGWSAGSAPAGSKTISNVQLEQGSTATDYQPYYGAIVHQGDIAPVVLYDKNSANANINWGYTNGISTSTGLTLEDKDFNGYSRLRCYFTTEGTRDGIYSGAFIVDVDLTEQVNAAGDNNYYCGIASTVTPYSLTVDNYFEIAICRVGVDSTKSKITFGEYGWNKTAVVGRGTPCYKIEGIK